MKILLDTQAFLWFVLNDSRLSSAANDAIVAADNQVLLSPASYWEIAIKIAIGKYSLNEPYESFIQSQLTINGFEILEIEPRHTAKLIGMPFHHRDPFDRLLVAQAIAELLPLVSSDSQLDQYGVQRLW